MARLIRGHRDARVECSHPRQVEDPSIRRIRAAWHGIQVLFHCQSGIGGLHEYRQVHPDIDQNQALGLQMPACDQSQAKTLEWR